MPSERSKQALLDIQTNINNAEKFVAGLTLEQFIGDEKTYYAAIRCLEIISEATRRLDDDIKNAAPDIPWRAIMDAGNVYRHAYHDIAEEWVWHTVQTSLPALKKVVEDALRTF